MKEVYLLHVSACVLHVSNRADNVDELEYLKPVTLFVCQFSPLLPLKGVSRLIHL